MRECKYCVDTSVLGGFPMWTGLVMLDATTWRTRGVHVTLWRVSLFNGIVTRFFIEISSIIVNFKIVIPFLLCNLAVFINIPRLRLNKNVLIKIIACLQIPMQFIEPMFWIFKVLRTALFKYDFDRGHWLNETLANHYYAPLNEYLPRSAASSNEQSSTTSSKLYIVSYEIHFQNSN